ncbi:unnamed protein product [Microthlaspi erraticum]|uniref:Uncharacterized protein n=1 Tax=Microthlaspi erraticum TaxID=1685480 RepID=A0A6D2L857_9BRAS|nr:unnamed protein product [Microthlaspi erraticum]
MADGFGYGGFSGAPSPFWLSTPYPAPAPAPAPYPPASVPPFLASHLVESYDPTRFDPMMFHGSYHRSPAGWLNNPSYRENSRSQTPSSSFWADNSRPGNCGPRSEDPYKDMFPPSGLHSSRESSADFVPLPTENFSERQRLNSVPTYNSATSAPGSALADMLNRNRQQAFYHSISPSHVYSPSNALDENRPGHYHPGYERPESMNTVPGPRVEPYTSVTDSIPSFPVPGLETQSIFDGNQSGVHLIDGGLFNNDVCHHHAPVEAQSNVPGSSVEPVNFDALLGLGESTAHVKPMSENPNLCNQIVGSPSSRSHQSSHPPQFNIKYRSHFLESSEGPSAPTMFSMGNESCGEVKAGSGDAQSAVNFKTFLEGSANQPTEDVQANQKPRELQEQMFGIMNREKKTTLLTDMGLKGSCRSNADDVSTGQSPEKNLCDQGDFPSPTSSPKISSVVDAMYNLSEVLVYECFNKGSGLKLEQLENLDKVVDNLTKCLKRITGNTAVAAAGVASLPTQAMPVSSPNVVDLNEASSVFAKDLQGLNVKPLDSFGFKEAADKNEMTQGIKNILASNFPDGEDNHPQTLLYKNLWLETEAALCSTTCMARYHRIKNEIGNLELQDREISADASTFMQEPFLNPQKSVPIMNNVEQETTESLIKHGSICGNNAVTMSHDAPQSSRFNADPVDAVLSLMSRSFTCALEPSIHGNFTPDATAGKILDAAINKESTTEDKHDDVIDRFQILKHLETKRKLKSQNCPDSDVGVTNLFQILKQQATDRILETQNCPETKVGVQEDDQEGSKMANIGRSSHAGDVMDRFQILKRREAEQVQKSLNSLNIDSDSDGDNDQPRSKTLMHGGVLGSASLMTRLCGFNSQMETCVDTKPSAPGKGNESPTSDWEHVLKDD